MSTPPSVPWPEFSHDPRRPENAALRASDRDRDVVLRVLGDAFADGRLDRAEYDERAEAVTKARTLGDLPAMVADLVPEAPLVPSADLHAQALEEHGRALRNAVYGAVSTTAVLTLIWFVLGLGFYWPVFFLLGTGGNVLRLLVQRRDWIADKERDLEKKQRRELERRQRGELEHRPDTED